MLNLRGVVGVCLCAVGGLGRVHAQGFPTDAVQEALAPWVDESAPGCSVAVIQDGRIVFEQGLGLANLEHSIPNTPETVFRLASMSKQFTAACVVLLSLDGALSLEDPIRKWIPELHECADPISLLHLIHHVSGLPDYLGMMNHLGNYDRLEFGTQDALDLLVTVKELQSKPGEEFVYCNSGYMLLGEVVARCSGKSLRRFAKKRIFDPLGMVDTHFHDNCDEVVPRRAYGYRKRILGGFALSMTNLEMVGDGALFSTVRDLVKWDHNFYEPTVGGEAFLQRMHEVFVLNNGKAIDYAKGLTVRTWKGTRQVSHAGSYVGFNTNMIRLPELKTTVICLSNRSDFAPTRRCFDVLRVVHPDLAQSRRHPIPSGGGSKGGAPRPW